MAKERERERGRASRHYESDAMKNEKYFIKVSSLIKMNQKWFDRRWLPVTKTVKWPTIRLPRISRVSEANQKEIIIIFSEVNVIFEVWLNRVAIDLNLLFPLPPSLPPPLITSQFPLPFSFVNRPQTLDIEPFNERFVACFARERGNAFPSRNSKRQNLETVYLPIS